MIVTLHGAVVAAAIGGFRNRGLTNAQSANSDHIDRVTTGSPKLGTGTSLSNTWRRGLVAAIVFLLLLIVLAPDASAQTTVSFTQSAVSEDEDDRWVTLYVRLSDIRKVPTTVTFTTHDITASANSDYDPGPYTLTFPSYSTGHRLLVNITDDQVYEGDETFEVQIVPPDGVSVGSVGTATVTLRDDEYQAPVVNFDQSTSTIDENAGIASIPFFLTPAPEKNMIFEFTYDDMTTTKGVDWSFTDIRVTAAAGTAKLKDVPTLRLPESTKLAIPAGTTQGAIHVRIINDFEFEDNELIRITMTPQGQSASDHDLIIIDDEKIRGYVGRTLSSGTYVCEGPDPNTGLSNFEEVEIDNNNGGVDTVRVLQHGPQVFPLPIGVSVDWDNGEYEIGDTASVTFRTLDGEPSCSSLLFELIVTLPGESQSQDVQTHFFPSLRPGDTEVSISVPLQAAGTLSFQVVKPLGYLIQDASGRLLSPSTKVTAPVTCPTCASEGETSVLTLASDVSSVREGNEVAVTVTAHPAQASGLAVNLRAIETMDLVSVEHTATVNIGPGETKGTWTFTAYSDSVERNDGTIAVRIDPGDGYTVGTPSSISVTLLDDDSGTDPNGEQSKQLPATHPLVKHASVVKRFYDRITARNQHGDGAAGGWNKRLLKAMGHPDYVDYPQVAVTVADATRIWNHGGPGANTAWDGTVDAVTYAEQYFAGQVPTPTPTPDPVPTPEVTIVAGTGITEGSSATFTLTANPVPTAPLQVGVTIATEGEFGIVAGKQTVIIPVTGSYTLTLASDNDGTNEPNGSVSVTVDDGDGYTVGTASSESVAIADNDQPIPAISVAAGASVTEGANVIFTVTADRVVDANLAVTLAVSEGQGSDFVAAVDEGARTVTILAGETTATLTVATLDDEMDEPDSSVTATVTAGSGYEVATSPNDTASIAVTDNDVPPAVPTLSIDDATGPEGKPMMFTVRLSAPSKQTVRVSIKAYESNPVSARANRDFIAAYYLVTFRPGETEQRRGFYIRDDSHDDGGETFEVRIRWAGDTPVADGVGVGTIENSDPLPAAYLSRFGRTVAEQAIDGIAQRFDASRTPGIEGTLAGQALRFDAPGSDPSSPAEVIHSVSPTDRLAEPFGGDSHLSPSTPQSYGMSSHEMLLNSSFTLTGESDSAGGTLALWGRTSQQSFDGTERGDGTDIRLDGKVTTTLLGTDYANNDLLLGLALAHSTGDGDYGAMSDEGVHPCENTEEVLCDDAIRAGDGTIESSLSALIPYASVSVSPRLKLWGAAGFGSGEVKVKVAEDDRVAEDESYSYSADTSWSMAAAGMRASVIEAPKEGSGGSLTLTSDYLWTQTSSDKTMDLAASKSKVTRLRFGLEGGYHMAMADGGSFVPKLQIGARHDGGDAETGFGIELGGGLSWQSPALGLQFELEGRTLVSHDDDDFENRGFAVSLVYDENAKSERGASFALRQHIGAPSSGGLDALFASEPLSKRSGNDAQRRVTLEGAYGLPAIGGHYTASPYGQMSFGETSRDYTIGWRWTPVNDAQDLSFGFKAVRSESLNAETENRFGFEAVARW